MNHQADPHKTSMLAELIERYDVNGPRYTSYPTANLFRDGDWQRDYAAALRETDGSPLAAYIHVPFCRRICYYCACNRIHTANRRHAARYLRYLRREMALHAERIPDQPCIEQLHFGGGTPTYLSDEQFQQVFDDLNQYFRLGSSAARDYSIEIDPRGMDPMRMAVLGKLGMNRLSLGIQDFDPQVQLAVNRVQSEQETADVVCAARENGFKSVSFDLIYGLPRQTIRGFEATLERVVRLKPERLSIYSYAHLPQRFKAQRQINAADLPDAQTKLKLLTQAVQFLTGHGFEYIGMDHFARPEDPLVAAVNDGTLQRNFMGYTTHGDCELLGLGVSAIGQVGRLYVQNEKELAAYYASIDQSLLPLQRGCRMSSDDQVRRRVIQDLTCRFHVNFESFADSTGTRFDQYFSMEMAELDEFIRAGLVVMDDQGLSVTWPGRFLVRNICMVFDAYLQAGASGFSKAI